MDRRRFLAVSAMGVLAIPIGADGQEAERTVRLGYLAPGDLSFRRRMLEWLAEDLRTHGWVEGKNLVIERRLGGDRYDRLLALAYELIRLKVDLIFASSAPAARAAKAATATIPIVFTMLNDPVRAGFVASFAQPGGNMTGEAGLGPELDRKRVELLKEMLPSLSRATVLLNATNPTVPQRLQEVEASARTLGIKLDVATASTANELEAAFATMAHVRPPSLIVLEDPTLIFYRRRIIEFVANQRIPTLYTSEGWAEQGGLLEYAVSWREMYRRSAVYVDRILRGSKPGNLPVEQPTKFDLVINLKTAKTLGLTIPPLLLLRADQVIE